MVIYTYLFVKIEEILQLAQVYELKALGAKPKNQFIYHIKNPSFKGKYIYPLSELQTIYPDLYKKEMKKYKGRENHPNIKINILDTSWKDCVNFSTLSPIKIFQLEQLLGVPGYKNIHDVDIFKFDIKDLKNMEMCLYDDNKSPRKDEAYKKININTYKETDFIPTATIKYFVKSKEKNEYPLLFGNVPHVLIKGSIPINKADIINFKNENI